MNPQDSLIRRIKKALPELASAKDLVGIGMYRTEQAAYTARQRGQCPPYLRIPARGIVYPRDGVIAFLKSKMNDSEVVVRIQDASISHSKAPPLLQNTNQDSR